MRDVSPLWQEVARELGGVFVEDSGNVPLRTTPKVEVDVGGARVLMDMNVKTGNSTAWTTRLRAHLALPGGPRFRIRPPGMLTSVGGAFGAKDVSLGEVPELDEAFVVRTREAEQTRRMWPRRSQLLLLGIQPRPRVRCDGSAVRLVVDALLDRRNVVDVALRLVGEVASTDLFGLAALEALPRATYHPPDGPWDDRSAPYAELPLLAAVIVGPVASGRRQVRTRAEATGLPLEHEVAVEIFDDGALEPEGPPLPPAATSAIRRVGKATLTVKAGRAELVWAGIEEDQDRLGAGADLVAAFATAPGRGAFR